MYAMVRETRPELSHEQAREMAATCSREPLPVAAPPADYLPALAPPPFIPPPLPMPPLLAPTTGHPAPTGPFAQESAPGYDGGSRYQQHQGHRGPRGQHFERREEDGVLVLGNGSRGGRTGACRIVPPAAVMGPRVAPVVAAPVDPSPAPVQPADTLVVPPLALAPVLDPPLVTNPPTARVGAQGHDMSTNRRNATQRAYARLDTGVLMPFPHLPFASDHNVSELVQFTSALRDAASSLRVACDDPHPYLWTKGWETCLERHVLRAVRSASPQAPVVKSMIAEAFSQGERLQKEDRLGPDILQHVIRCLCRGLSRATPAAVMQALQNLVVPVGTPFSSYLSEMKLLVGNVRCIGHVAPEDGTMQIAIKTGVDDQFAGLSAHFFAGRNMRALLFDSVDDFDGIFGGPSVESDQSHRVRRIIGGDHSV